MGKKLDRLKDAVRSIQGEPVTEEWLNMVMADREAEAERIEQAKGAGSADRYREKTADIAGKMLRRGVIGGGKST